MTSDIPPPPPGPGDGQQPTPSYPSYPASSGSGEPVPAYPGTPGQAAANAPQPPSIVRAVMLMRAGAVLSIVSLVAGMATSGSLKDNIKKQLEDNGNYTQSNFDTAYNATIATVVVAGVLGVVLWLWMAHTNGKGRKWARVVATALGALSILSFVLVLGQGQAPALSLVLSAVTALLAIVILVLLWRRESTEFYLARSRRAYS